VDAVKYGMFARSQLKQAHIEKHTDSIPVYPLNYEETICNTGDKLKRFKNVFAIGKPGSLYYCLSKGAMNHGIETAEYILHTSRNNGRAIA